jgi:steroid delta-isomerase-like uncharacterized protein
MKQYGRIGLVLIPMVLAAPSVGAEGPAPGQVVDRFYDSYRNGSVEGMMRLYAEDAVFEDVNQRHRLQGSEQLQGFLAGIVGLHAEIGLREKRRVTVGDTVVVEYEYTGILSGAALRQVSGKDSCQDTEYSLPVTSWYDVQDGHIVHQKDFIDLATFLEIQQQIQGQAPDEPGGS